jgi:hypothetical protein
MTIVLDEDGNVQGVSGNIGGVGFSSNGNGPPTVGSGGGGSNGIQIITQP